jgi:hypothetical protein
VNVPGKNSARSNKTGRVNRWFAKGSNGNEMRARVNGHG